MKLIELHILQSFPVSCLNRDDVGSPKSAGFGGIRSRHLLRPFSQALEAEGMEAEAAAKQAADSV